MGRAGRWASLRYRRSLASRVTLLTTMAVGLAVTVVAFAAYATVRMQSMESLDESLHTRGRRPPRNPNRWQRLARREVPAWALGAADVKLVVVDARRAGPSRGPTWTRPARPDGTEFDVALGKESWSARTVLIDGDRYRVVAVPVPNGTGRR